MLAMTIPLRQRTNLKSYAENLNEIVNTLQTCPENTKPVLSRRQIEIIDDLEDWTNRVQSPLQHLEHRLHNWVAWFVMPVFALANAGINFSSDVTPNFSLVINISLSLILGKSLGIAIFSWIGMKTRLIELPGGITFRQIIGVAFLAGVGFTMSIFIAGLAFPGNPVLIDSAKGGILAGSALAGIIGFLVLRVSGKKS